MGLKPADIMVVHDELELPYADDRELVQDILRHGGEVEVLAPPELRRRVRAEHQRAARLNR